MLRILGTPNEQIWPVSDYTIQVFPLPSVEFLVFKFSCNHCSVFRSVPDVARPTVVND